MRCLISCPEYLAAAPVRGGKRFFISVSLLLLLSAFPVRLAAQHWQKIYHFNVSGIVPYFVNDSIGFVYGAVGVNILYNAGASKDGHSLFLARTLDGGYSWTEIHLPAIFYDTGVIQSSIEHLSFTSVAHGYLAAEIDSGTNDGYSLGGIFETDDTGSTWRMVLKGPSCSDVYAVDSFVFAQGAFFTPIDTEALFISTDRGNKWVARPYGTYKHGTTLVGWVTGNRDSLIIADKDVYHGPNWSFLANSLRGAPVAFLPHTRTVAQIEAIRYNINSIDYDSTEITISHDAGLTSHVTYYSAPDEQGRVVFGGLEADGCAIYAQRTMIGPFNEGSAEPGGLIRSADAGETWVHVGGPDADYGAYPISVVGGGAIVYAMQDTANDGADLWKTTDGGDGLLTASKNPIITSAIHLPSFSDTLVTMPCDSVNFWLWLQYQASCVEGRLYGVKIDGMDSIGSYTSILTQHPLYEGRPDTAWTTIFPIRPGTYPITIRAQYMDDDHDVSDTSFHLVLLIKPNPNAFLVSQTLPLDFGAQSLCAPARVLDSFAVKASGCENIRVDTIAFYPDSALFTDFSFKPIRNFIPSNDSAIYFPISFKPSMADTERGSIVITWNDGEAQHTDTIRVEGAGVQDTRSFAVGSPTVTVQMCDSSTGTITLTNTTCGLLELDSLSLPAGLGLPLKPNLDPQLPLFLKPGASDTLAFELNPADALLSSGDTILFVRAYLLYSDKGGSVAFDTVLPIQVHVMQSAIALALSDTALDLGTFSRCNAVGDTVVTFTNTGCDSLALSGASVAAGSGFTLLAGGDTVLAPGESARYTIGFWDTTAGELVSALHMRAIGAHGGNTIDTTVPLRAMVVAGSRLAALNTQSIDVGTTSICEERDSSITIKNTGCEPDTITTLSFANTTFSSLQPLPIIIPPHSDTTISIATVIDTTGHATANTDTLQVAGNLDAPLLPVVLSRGIQYPDHFSLALSAPDSAPVRATVPVYVLRKGTVPSQAAELDFSLLYNDDLLGYVQPVQPDISSIASTLLPSGLTERSFAMKPASDRDTIATIQFQSYLTRNDVTPITLTGQNFQVVGPTPAACVATLDTGAVGQNFTLELACGYGPMINTIKNVPFKITSIETEADLLNFRVLSSDPRYRSCEAQLLNILGTIEAAKPLTASPNTSVSFDIHALPAGAYFLRVSAGGYATQKPVMILK